MLLISLIGEQPIPNLLPVRHLRADENMLIHSNLSASQKTAKRLASLVPGSTMIPLREAYQIPKILAELHEVVKDRSDAVINLTGGTKPMSLAAFELAKEKGYQCIYYQTEGPHGRDQKSILYWYAAGENLELLKREELPDNLLTLKDYLNAHLDGFDEAGFSKDSGGNLENAVYQALRPVVDEIMAGVKPRGIKDQAEVDVLIRCGNHVAVLEIKTGGSGSGKHAVDQLTTIAARENLGTYAARFLVTQASPEDRYKALADVLKVRVIELKDYIPGKILSAKDTTALRNAIADQLPLKHVR